MNMNASRFSLRQLFILTTILSVLLGAWLWFSCAKGKAQRDAVREAYMQGRITLEEARNRVGDAVDTWPHPPLDKPMEE
jgi:hypothetical protein